VPFSFPFFCFGNEPEYFKVRNFGLWAVSHSQTASGEVMGMINLLQYFRTCFFLLICPFYRRKLAAGSVFCPIFSFPKQSQNVPGIVPFHSHGNEKKVLKVPNSLFLAISHSQNSPKIVLGISRFCFDFIEKFLYESFQ
jgi:hypothetical protein